MPNKGWGATVSGGAGPVYEHYFDEARARSVCGRSDISRVGGELYEQAKAGQAGIQPCSTCLKVLAKRQRALAPSAVNVGKDRLPADKLSCGAAVELMTEHLGESILTANALYNRVWRVANAGADPATAPEFITSFGRIYFTRQAVMTWLALELVKSKGVDLSRASQELQGLVAEAF